MDSDAYQGIAHANYASLYRFALSLCRTPADAADLTQEAFQKLAQHGDSLRDPSRAKSWLFTTVYRAFLQRRRHDTHFPEVELSEAEPFLPYERETDLSSRLDAATALAALLTLDEHFRAPLTLFYLEDHSYAEIAKILDVPIGTVMSRIARGKALLREKLSDAARPVARNIELVKTRAV